MSTVVELATYLVFDQHGHVNKHFMKFLERKTNNIIISQFSGINIKFKTNKC